MAFRLIDLRSPGPRGGARGVRLSGVTESGLNIGGTSPVEKEEAMEVEMIAMKDFIGDSSEGFHKKDQEFITTPSRAVKYEGVMLARTIAKVTRVEEEIVMIGEPHKPQEFKKPKKKTTRKRTVKK